MMGSCLHWSWKRIKSKKKGRKK